jgi:hypothetical protein
LDGLAEPGCVCDPECHDGPDGPACETPPERAAREQVAREVCAECPHRRACLAFTARTGPRRGIWAGLTADQVAALAARPRTVTAVDVAPGMVVWNPYGGRHGHIVVAGTPRRMPDGSVEFTTADGRTARFRPGFRLYLNWPAMDAA